MPPAAVQHPAGARNLPDELVKIRHCVEATNRHISHLESAAENIVEEGISDVKHALQDAHRGLERLEAQFAVVGEIKKEVWQTYRRLRAFEEKTRQGEDISVRDFTRPARTGTIRVVPEVQSSSVSGSTGGHPEDPGVGYSGSENWKVEAEGQHPRPFSFVAGPDETSAVDLSKMEMPVIEGGEWQDAVVAAPKIVPIVKSTPDRKPVSMPTRRHQVERQTRFDSLAEGAIQKDKSQKRQQRLLFPTKSSKTREDVIENVAKEESRGGTKLNDPRRKREGSADGTLITQAVVTADTNPDICAPHLAYLKIHEVRALKAWLTAHKYLHKSRRISRTEKVLHLLTVLQVGCRFESVAVLFSRRPKEVLSACNEVFQGLLEMHSETMLPNRRTLSRYLYPALWHIVHNYHVRNHGNSGGFMPWEKEDIRKVLITLNLYMGRYRSQGQLALAGDMIDWGKYIHIDAQENVYDVPLWIERLQPGTSNATRC